MNKNYTKILSFSLVIVIVLIVITITVNLESNKVPSISNNNDFSTTTIKIDNIVLSVQVADTFDKRKQGLQFQEELAYDQGMLFDFVESRVISMWMPNMKFSLDMIWFDDKGNVVYIEKNMQPCDSIDACKSVDPNGQKARYVLEVTSGFIDKFGINENSRLYFD